MRIEWTEKLESGYKEIDDQHRDLINRINEFFDGLEKHYTSEATTRTLKYLVGYVKKHFSTEERLMTEYGYEEYDHHYAAHKKLTEELVSCYRRLVASGNSAEVSEDLTEVLQVWFLEHILGYDMKMIDFLKSKTGDRVE